jgi:hypothetical protein
MGFVSQAFYAVVCDWPECKAIEGSGEYTYWSDQEYALDAAADGDWTVAQDDNRAFCPQHSACAYWLSEGPEPASYPIGTDITPVADDARVLVLPDGEMVALR